MPIDADVDSVRGPGSSRWTVAQQLARLRTLFPSRRSAIVLAAGAATTGLAEATVLFLVAKTAIVISSGNRVLDVDLGPYSARLALSQVITITFIALAVRITIGFVVSAATARLATATMVRLRKDAFDSFVSASWETQTSEPQGALQDMATTYANRAASATLAAASGLGALFNFLALLLSAFVVNALTSAAIVLAAPILFLALRPVSALGTRYARAQREGNRLYVRSVSEAATLTEEIHTFGVGAQISERAAAQTDDVATAYRGNQLLARFLPDLYLSVVLILALGGLTVLYVLGLQGYGSLSAIVLISLRALMYSRQLQSVFHSISEQRPFISQLERRITRYRQSAAPEGSEPLERIETLELREVTFSYDRGVPALANVSCTISEGEAIGVIGPSGAGKSTLVQVLLRLRTPDTGEYLVNGRRAADVLRADWHREMAYVPQDARLYDGSVADNVRFFRPWITDDEIVEAARIAQIHDEIVSWPQGYDTDLGTSGAATSGGQRQRICLARALAGGPSVLVLDEPTSSLDMKSESLVQRALEEMRGSTTLIIVAHRLSTISMCNRIMVLDGGELRAFASAEDLVANDGYYREAIALSQLR